MPAWPEDVAIRLLTLRRRDGWLLEAALYAPTTTPRSVGVVFVHGKGENFYSGPGRWVPPHLVARGYPCLALNMRCHDIDVLTVGQYLRPSKKHAEVVRYYRPEEFVRLKEQALAMGFGHVEAGPLVRSSYHADEQVPAAQRKSLLAG